RIVRWRKGGRIETVIAKSNRANGLCFDRDGMLIACEGMEDDASIPDEGRALTRRDLASGTRTVLCDRYEGRRFNSPNDLCIDREGFIYFTDPYYGGDRKRIEQDCEGVYRVRSDGSGVKRILDAKDVKRPNGIAISPDRKTLYVVDNKPDEPPSRMVLAFNLAEDGTASGRRVLFDFKGGRGGDGMSIDMEGNLYVAAGANRKYPNQSTQFPAGVYVISPQGKLLQTIKISEDMCTNCCFGGEDGRTLFVTAGKTLFAVPTTKIGYNVWPTAAP
ncbi:MAG TPA: SMP-30/gluconolactonase/LRE family protein, partial [Planctomycetia bacterium]|nr:SMP-30/gluconolactonase/LRE family protein [Planctomycetia bacterium]